MSEMIETDPDGIIIDLIDPAERSGTDNTDLQ